MILAQSRFVYAVLILATMATSSPAVAASCKSYSTCRQAVIAWCEGRHPGADRDDDGIPCENVCKSRSAVMAIMNEIGCQR